jgi:hypothetical protein
MLRNIKWKDIIEISVGLYAFLFVYPLQINKYAYIKNIFGIEATLITISSFNWVSSVCFQCVGNYPTKL